MTNYINSIELDGTVYTVGPLKVDDYDNIVSHNINLNSHQHSNVIIGNSSFELTPSSKDFNNNIIIGNPNLQLLEDSNITNFDMLNSSGNIVIGNSNNLVCITPSSVACNFNGVTITIAGGHIGVGPLDVNVYHISNANDYIPLHGPANVYAVGSCFTSQYTGDTIGHAHISLYYSATQDNPCVKVFSVSGDTIGYADGKEFKGGTCAYYQDTPLIGFYVDSTDGTNNKLYFAVCSNLAATTNYDISVYTYSWPAPM